MLWSSNFCFTLFSILISLLCPFGCFCVRCNLRFMSCRMESWSLMCVFCTAVSVSMIKSRICLLWLLLLGVLFCKLCLSPLFNKVISSFVKLMSVVFTVRVWNLCVGVGIVSIMRIVRFFLIFCYVYLVFSIWVCLYCFACVVLHLSLIHI